MAEPLTIIGAMGAIGSIIDVVAKSLKSLDIIRNKWGNLDLTVLSIHSQLTALRAALTKIQEWMAQDLQGAHNQLIMDMDVSLSCCRLLTAKIEEVLSRVDHGLVTSPLNSSQKLKMLYTEGKIDDIEKMLNRQVSALTLLLTACNCKSMSTQKMLLEEPKSRKALHRVTNDCASLLVHRGTVSWTSSWKDRLSKLSVVFDFDSHLFSSKVYERALRGSLEDSLRQQQAPKTVHTEVAYLYDPLTEFETTKNQTGPCFSERATSGMSSDPETGTFAPQEHTIRRSGDSYQDTRSLILIEPEKPIQRHGILLLGSDEIAKLQVAKSISPWNRLKAHYMKSYRKAIYKDVLVSGRNLAKLLQSVPVHLHQQGDPSSLCSTVARFSAEDFDRLTIENLIAFSQNPCALDLLRGTPGLGKARYYIAAIDRIAALDYVPTEDDIRVADLQDLHKMSHSHIHRNGLHINLVNLIGFPIVQRGLPSRCLAPCIYLIFAIDLANFKHDPIGDKSNPKLKKHLNEFHSVIGMNWQKEVSIMLLFTNSPERKFRSLEQIVPVLDTPSGETQSNNTSTTHLRPSSQFLIDFRRKKINVLFTKGVRTNPQIDKFVYGILNRTIAPNTGIDGALASDSGDSCEHVNGTSALSNLDRMRQQYLARRLSTSSSEYSQMHDSDDSN
ncbi:hypothetical protein P154DRAFT_574048 [Amniculicola lignicola CBS 123094]|uniref:Fungal N-terminal domain-containing protein n=1 Tax=Amniculicola lignicola CBS 123094 TaxID=1392246 RepID=A0A6A5WN81_9PLEO|nr:hypothetical protein P154DRAFT_574048 [Amniculicola lignicola CBS 123094]